MSVFALWGPFLIPAEANHGVYQVGANTDALEGNAGIRTTLVADGIIRHDYIDDEMVSQQVTNFFWVGGGTDTGEFVHIGYAAGGWGCGSSFYNPLVESVFYNWAAIYDPAGNLDFDVLGGCWQPSDGDAWRYSLTRPTGLAAYAGNPIWTASAQRVSNEISYSTTYLLLGVTISIPGVISELSPYPRSFPFGGGTFIDNVSAELGTVRYHPALEALMPTDPANPFAAYVWKSPPLRIPMAAARAIIDTPPCGIANAERFGISVHSANDISVGDGLQCRLTGEALWY